MSDSPHVVTQHDVFVDTSFFFALLVAQDGRHEDARRIYRAVLKDRRKLVVSHLVLIELHSLITRRVRAAVATAALFHIEASDATIIRVDENDELRARNILGAYSDKEFSLLDATSFAVMERLNLTTALSFDKHFAQFGWTVLAE